MVFRYFIFAVVAAALIFAMRRTPPASGGRTGGPDVTEVGAVRSPARDDSTTV